VIFDAHVRALTPKRNVYVTISRNSCNGPLPTQRSETKTERSHVTSRYTCVPETNRADRSASASIQLPFKKTHAEKRIIVVMPRYCNIKDCKKVSKWKSEGTIPTIHLCDTHSKAIEEVTFIKIVNSPCRTCVAEKKQDIREASFGPIIKGKKKRWYCKQHIPIDRMIQKK